MRLPWDARPGEGLQFHWKSRGGKKAENWSVSLPFRYRFATDFRPRVDRAIDESVATKVRRQRVMPGGTWTLRECSPGRIRSPVRAGQEWPRSIKIRAFTRRVNVQVWRGVARACP